MKINEIVFWVATTIAAFLKFIGTTWGMKSSLEPYIIPFSFRKKKILLQIFGFWAGNIYGIQELQQNL